MNGLTFRAAVVRAEQEQIAEAALAWADRGVISRDEAAIVTDEFLRNTPGARDAVASFRAGHLDAGAFVLVTALRIRSEFAADEPPGDLFDDGEPMPV